MSGIVVANNETTELVSLIAGFPMYDLPHLQKHNDILWNALAQRLIAAGIKNVPRGLTRAQSSLDKFWRMPNLLLTQTCGYPLVTGLGRDVQVVATPIYKAQGCDGAFHRSAIIVHRDSNAGGLKDLANGHCAVNELTSNTGMNLFRAKIAPLACGRSFFKSVSVTGSHARSLEFVATQRSDVAAIDCITFAHLKTFAPALFACVKVLDWTDSAPGLPFITSKSTTQNTLQILRDALIDLLADTQITETREALLLEEFDFLEADAYQKISDIELSAVSLSYPVLS